MSNPFGFHPRDSCPFCLSPENTLPYEVKVVRFPKEGNVRLSYEWTCIGCGRQWREFVFPEPNGSHSKVERRMVAYDAPKPKSLEGMAVIFQHDLTMYTGWKEVLEELLTEVNRQMASKTYSNMAIHFLKTAQIVLRMLRSLVERRIRSVDDWFKGQKT